MNARIQRLKGSLKLDEYPICVEKARLIREAYRQHEGEPTILRRSKATAYYLDNKTLFIEPDDLIIGNVAGKPMGMEAGSLGPTWPKEDIEDLRKAGLQLSDEDKALLRTMDEYWKGKGRTLDEWQGQFYDDERLWPFIQSRILCPPWKKKDEGRGWGRLGAWFRVGPHRGGLCQGNR